MSTDFEYVSNLYDMSFLEYHNCLETVLTQHIKCNNDHAYTRSGDAGFPKI